ncbi:MAG TPA: ABC transporter ATP-binding protein [Aggregatilineaceae bacterium]|nr:ABC transporter ATP-binding protein [Aggregatilineaceae bacterium]
MSDSIAIQIENLHKHFGRRKRVQAVNNLNLEVAAGQVYGFLGPNGAGKTTTIRMLLGLIRPSQGSVYLFGQHVQQEHAVLSRVGSLVEGATFYDFLTGRRNLEVFALTSNLSLPASRFDEVLRLVDMQDRSRRRVKGYSTGMKQRLGIAAAMLTDPDLLILDEPANGLDPHGINEIRTLIRQLVDEHGKTVFLSSHQLGEVEQVCDRVAIINKGELIREGTVANLLNKKAQIHIRATPLEQAAAAVNGQWACRSENGSLLLVDAQDADVPIIVDRLVKNGIKIFEVSPQRQSLEDYFLSVTEGENSHVE